VEKQGDVMSKKAFLGVFSLVMITVGSVDSIRNLPATALFGSDIIAFFLVAALFFLLPSGLISAELASQAKEGQGGIYRWVTEAFGKPAGFIAIWFQWISNVVYYPALLAYIAGTVAYLIHPSLVQNKLFLGSFILVAFWAVTFLNLLGMKSSSWVANTCAFFGLVLPMALIIGMGVVWFFSGKPLHVDLHPAALIPNFAHPSLWITLAGVMLSMCGMEIATIHVRETKDPERTFPKALLISTVFILITLTLGALSIALVIPSDQLSFIAGLMQAFDVFFTAYHLHGILPFLALALILGGLGGLNNWLIAPTRGLHYAGMQGHFPQFLVKENKYGAPQNLLFIQGGVVTLCLLAFVLLPSINASYWYLNVLAAQLYMVMYVLMFSAGIRLRFKNKPKSGYRIPGGKWGTACVGGLGMIGSVATFSIGFFPPDGINVGSAGHYAWMVCMGILVSALPAIPFIIARYQNGKISKK
jgi:amino acid transporter